MRVKAGSCGHCSAGNGLNNRQNHSPGCVTHLTGPGQLLETAGATGSATSQKGTEATWAAIATKQPSWRNSHRNETAIATRQPARRTASTANSHRGEQPCLRDQDRRATKTPGQPKLRDSHSRG
jgi:transcription elongation factor